jgi:hypothetical protein
MLIFASRYSRPSGSQLDGGFVDVRGDQSTVEWLLKRYDIIDRVARDAGDDVPIWELREVQIIGADPRFQSLIIDRSAESTPQPTTPHRASRSAHGAGGLERQAHDHRALE